MNSKEKLVIIKYILIKSMGNAQNIHRSSKNAAEHLNHDNFVMIEACIDNSIKDGNELCGQLAEIYNLLSELEKDVNQYTADRDNKQWAL